MRSFDNATGVVSGKDMDAVLENAIARVDAATQKENPGATSKGGYKLLVPTPTAGRDQSVEKAYRLHAAGVLTPRCQ